MFSNRRCDVSFRDSVQIVLPFEVIVRTWKQRKYTNPNGIN